MLPSPLRYIPLVASAPPVAERVAIGVAVLLTFKTANLAEEVDCPPISRSTVELLGVRNPAPKVQLDPPPPLPHDPKVAAAPAPPDLRQSPLVPSEIPSFIPPA